MLPPHYVSFKCQLSFRCFFLKFLWRHKNGHKRDDCWHTVRVQSYQMNVDLMDKIISQKRFEVILKFLTLSFWDLFWKSRNYMWDYYGLQIWKDDKTKDLVIDLEIPHLQYTLVSCQTWFFLDFTKILLRNVAVIMRFLTFGSRPWYLSKSKHSFQNSGGTTCKMTVFFFSEEKSGEKQQQQINNQIRKVLSLFIDHCYLTENFGIFWVQVDTFLRSLLKL